MHRSVWLLPLALFVTTAAHAQESAAPVQKPVRVGITYAFSAYLADNGGNAPVGFCVSVASTGPIGFEGEMAYHRDEEEVDSFFYSETWVLHTLTVAAGPRFTSAGAKDQPFGHILFGMRYDTVEDFDNWAFGGEIGGGIDVATGGVFLRLGADFQIFFDEGENVKTLRLTGGIAF